MRTRDVVVAVVLALVLGVCAAGLWPASAAPGKTVLYVPVINIYTEKGFGNPEWKKAALDKMLANWSIPKRLPKEGQKMVFICIVTRDGRLTSARDVEYSGDKEWDQAAAEALKASVPFPPLPPTGRRTRSTTTSTSRSSRSNSPSPLAWEGRTPGCVSLECAAAGRLA